MIILGILMAVIAHVSHAAPILLERDYTTYAFGYRSKGCFIDQNGYVYAYDVSAGKPIATTGSQLTEGEIQKAKDLLNSAARGQFKERRAVYDAGSTLWSGTYFGAVVKLKSTGDYMGVNSAAEAQELIDIIEKSCGRESS